MLAKNIFLIVALLSSILSSCATTPEQAGVSESEINAEAAKAYADVKAKAKMSGNSEWNQMVQRVSQRIARASGKSYQWEAVLIESPEVNAWCMPGGKIAVYTGIMPVVKNEAALAAVLGHEVAHATLKHGLSHYARAKQENYINLAIIGATIIGGEILCKSQRCKQLTRLGGTAAGFALVFFDRKFSREDESAADREGQIYMARAGYDPAESIRFWDRMGAAKGGSAPPEFLSTHPSDVRRKSNLQQWLPGAETEYQNSAQKYGIGESVR